MTILETDKIDLVATREDTNIVKLIIADHLTWDDVESHCQSIQEKVNTYIAFVESGQLLQTTQPTIPKDPKVQIVLSLQHEPSPEARTFLHAVSTFLEDLRLDFVWQTHPNAH